MFNKKSCSDLKYLKFRENKILVLTEIFTIQQGYQHAKTIISVHDSSQTK